MLHSDWCDSPKSTPHEEVAKVVVQENFLQLVGVQDSALGCTLQARIPSIIYDTVVTFLYNSILENRSNPLMLQKLKLVSDMPPQLMIWMYDMLGTQAIQHRKLHKQQLNRVEPNVVTVYKEHHFPTGLGMVKDKDVTLPITDSTFCMQMFFWQDLFLHQCSVGGCANIAWIAFKLKVPLRVFVPPLKKKISDILRVMHQEGVTLWDFNSAFGWIKEMDPAMDYVQQYRTIA